MEYDLRLSLLRQGVLILFVFEKATAENDDINGGIAHSEAVDTTIR
jgi:hypothetical protein